MTAGDTSDGTPPAVRGGDREADRAANRAALWWLARWIGLPFLLVVGIYQAEPLLRGGPAPERVAAVTQQDVHAYPFAEGAPGLSLAPPDVARPGSVPLPSLQNRVAPVPTRPADIVAQPIAQPQPRYPQRALDQEREGTVRVELTIAPDGTVSAVKVLAADPPGWFEAAAIAAVRQWRYHPPGRPLVTEAVIEFKLD
jgi:TonB family protein